MSLRCNLDIEERDGRLYVTPKVYGIPITFLLEQHVREIERVQELLAKSSLTSETLHYLRAGGFPTEFSFPAEQEEEVRKALNLPRKQEQLSL